MSILTDPYSSCKCWLLESLTKGTQRHSQVDAGLQGEWGAAREGGAMWDILVVQHDCPAAVRGVMAVAAMAVLDGSGGGSSSDDAAQSQNLLHAAGHVPSCLWSHPHPPISSMLTDSLRLWRNMCWPHRGTVLILQHLGYKWPQNGKDLKIQLKIKLKIKT